MIVYAFMAGPTVSVGGHVHGRRRSRASSSSPRMMFLVTAYIGRRSATTRSPATAFSLGACGPGTQALVGHLPDAHCRHRRHRRRRLHRHRRLGDRRGLCAWRSASSSPSRLKHRRPARSDDPHRDHLGGGRRDDRLRLGGDLHAHRWTNCRRKLHGAVAVGMTDRTPCCFMLLVAVALFVVGMLPRIERRLHHAGAAAASDRASSTASIRCTSVSCSCFNLVIGMLTPPVGVVLFVLCGITGHQARRAGQVMSGHSLR